MEMIRLCGNGWAYCEGNCDSCGMSHIYATNCTEPQKEAANGES